MSEKRNRLTADKNDEYQSLTQDATMQEHLQTSSAEIIQSLKNKERSEEEKFRSMTHALNWLHQELKSLKQQDKSLMKQFNHIREQINDLRELDNDTYPDAERDRSLSCISEIMDNEDNDDNIHSRRTKSMVETSGEFSNQNQTLK